MVYSSPGHVSGKEKKRPNHKTVDIFFKVFRNMYAELGLSSEYICVDNVKDKMHLKKLFYPAIGIGRRLINE